MTTVAPASPRSSEAQPAARVRSFVLCGIRFSHMRTALEGWASDRGYADGAQVTSLTLVSLTKEVADGRFCGVRLIVGRHSFWALR